MTYDLRLVERWFPCFRRKKSIFILTLIFVIFCVLFLYSAPYKSEVFVNFEAENTRSVISSTPKKYQLMKTVNMNRSIILNEPLWVIEKNWKLIPADHSVSFQIRAKEGPQDGEDEFAWKNFFNGTTNGLILELGAVDGNRLSVSKFFEEKAGWKSILIESGEVALKIPQNRPEALSLRMAVCENESIVHFVDAYAVGGVLELMTDEFLQRFHKNLLKNQYKHTQFNQSTRKPISEIVDWNKIKLAKNIYKLSCLPLQPVFDYFNITRINFMVLDLEGGELSALKSLDFSRIEFDVISVETNRVFNPEDPYIDQVIDFLEQNDYKLFERLLGRNTWFVKKKKVKENSFKSQKIRKFILK